MSANLCQTRPPTTGRLRTSPGLTRDHPVNISSGRTGTCDYIGEQVGADCSLAGARTTLRSIPDRNLADVAWSRPPQTHRCERRSTTIWRFWRRSTDCWCRPTWVKAKSLTIIGLMRRCRSLPLASLWINATFRFPDFYSASALLAQQNAVMARADCPSVCPSVRLFACLSVAFRCFVQTYNLEKVQDRR